MGMSASQARLLSLTSRLSDLELQAQTISNAKIRLADEGAAASKEYSDALNQQKLKVYSGYNTIAGTPIYADATINNLTSYDSSASGKQRFIQNAQGQILISSAMGEAYINADGDLEAFLNNLGYSQFASDDEKAESYSTQLVSMLSSDIANVCALMTETSTYSSKTIYGSDGITASSYADYETINDITTTTNYNPNGEVANTIYSKSCYSGTSNAGHYTPGDAATSITTQNYSDSNCTIPTNWNTSTYTPTSANTYTTSTVNSDGTAFTTYSVWSHDSTSGTTTVNTYSDQAHNQLISKTVDTPISTTADAQNYDSNASYEIISSATANDFLQALQEVLLDLQAMDQVFDIGTSFSSIETMLSNLMAGPIDANTVAAALQDGSQTEGINTANINNTNLSAGLTSDYQLPVNSSNDNGAVEYYTNVFNQIAENGAIEINNDEMNSTEWLQAGIQAGTLFLYTYKANGGTDGTGAFENVSWTSGDLTLQGQTDNADIAKAEAAYETTMADIQAKDKRFDLQLKNIDTEHSAIQTGIESVKKVIDKNIERSFKIFNA